MATDAHANEPTAQDQERPKSEFELGHDDPNAYSLTVVGIVGVLAVYLIIMGAMGFYLFFEQREIERKVYAAPHRAFVEYLASERRVLEDPHAAAADEDDEEEAEALARRVPIDEAMRLALRSVAATPGQAPMQTGDAN